MELEKVRVVALHHVIALTHECFQEYKYNLDLTGTTRGRISIVLIRRRLLHHVRR